MAGGGGAGEGEPEFQIAPLIDVLLVLLIFFMSIATTTLGRYDQGITLPTADSAVKKKNSEAEAVFNVYWDDVRTTAVVTWDGAEVDLRAVSADLAARREKLPDLRLLIRGDRRVPAATIGRVLEAAARAGVVDITFSTLPPPGGRAP